MKPDSERENDEQLREILRQWQVDAPLPPRFQEQVWRRIERVELKSQPRRWAGFWPRVRVLLPRPKFAFAYLSLFLALGIAAGALAAQVRTSRVDSELGLRYVRSVAPYQAAGSQP